MYGQLNKKSVLFYAFVFSSDLVTCIYSMNLNLIYRDSSHLFRDSKLIILHVHFAHVSFIAHVA